MPTKTQLKGLLKYHVAPRTKQLKWVWQRYGNMVEPKLSIPDNLKGLNIIDPLNPLSKNYTKWISPTRHPSLEFLVSQFSETEHPCWQDTPAFIIEPQSKINLGIPQACILTNTQIANEKLPKQVEDSKMKLTEDQHSAVREIIRGAYVLDPTKERLPPKIRYTRPWSLKVGDVGISMKRKAITLMDKLIVFLYSLISSQGTPIKNIAAYNSPFYLNFPFGDDIIHFRRRCHAMILNDKPLLLSPESNDDFTNYSYENLLPMFPTVGLKKSNIYDIGYCSGHSKNTFLHTFFMVEEEQPLTEMLPEKFLPKMILNAFAHAACEALRTNPSSLSHDITNGPIYLFGVGIVEEEFHFLVYELNSLNPLGKPNRVWIDSQNSLMLDFPRMIGDVDRIIKEANIDDYIMNRMNYQSQTVEKLFSIFNFGRL